jgi:hypothetical protein
MKKADSTIRPIEITDHIAYAVHGLNAISDGPTMTASAG